MTLRQTMSERYKPNPPCPKCEATYANGCVRQQASQSFRKESNTMTHAMFDHEWELVERGYERTWSTYIRPNTQTLEATYQGSSDFSEEGDGVMILRCRTCLHEKPVPDGWTVHYR